MGKLTVMAPGKPEVIEFNGQPEEREAVAETFRELMAEGGFLAYQIEAPERPLDKPEKVQIRADEFPVHDPEAEVVLTPHLAGG